MNELQIKIEWSDTECGYQWAIYTADKSEEIDEDTEPIESGIATTDDIAIAYGQAIEKADDIIKSFSNYCDNQKKDFTSHYNNN